MLKIHNFITVRLRNDAHFQFFTEVLNLLRETGAENLKIEAAWAMFLRCYEALDAALRKIVKSALTAQIKEADAARDAAFSAFAKFLAAMCEHYDDAVREAARKIEVVAHTYGNVTVKPLDEETSAIYNLVQELNTDKYKSLVALTGLTPWVAKLAARNAAFEALVQERDRESAAKNHAAVREERQAIDEVYRYAVEMINAMIYFGLLTGCGSFVDTLNAIIRRFSVKHRHRRRGADGAYEEEEPEEIAEVA